MMTGGSVSRQPAGQRHTSRKRNDCRDGPVNPLWPHCDGLIWPHPSVTAEAPTAETATVATPPQRQLSGVSGSSHLSGALLVDLDLLVVHAARRAALWSMMRRS